MRVWRVLSITNHIAWIGHDDIQIAYFLSISGKKPKIIKPACHYRRKAGTVARLLLGDA
jgi:hypothetical protein